MGWIVAVLLLLVGIGVGAYFILRQREKTARQPVEIVLGSKNEKKTSEETPKSEKASEPPAAESKTPASTQSSAPENKPPSKPSTPEKPSPPSTSKAPVPERATYPQPTLTTPQKGRYYIIVGSEPTLEAAYTKAKALGIPTAEFLPVPERGRVRISYHSTPNKAEAEARLKEVKARIPDAWLYTP
jgi:cell division protein FtsN